MSTGLQQHDRQPSNGCLHFSGSVSAILRSSFDGCEAGCLCCGEVNDLASVMRDRVSELEQAIVNIYRWTGSKRCARECKRVVPNVVKLAQEKLNAKSS